MLSYVVMWITLIANIVLIFGIGIAIAQLIASQKAMRAQLLIKLSDDWQKDDILQAVRYIHNLRREWKTSLHNQESMNGHDLLWEEQCEKLAEKWVADHVGKRIESEDEYEKRLANEWLMRRKASQFLAKMGALVVKKYLKPDDLFGVIPEAGRLMIVLIPIEVAIERYFSGDEIALRSWDKPVPKWEFRYLWKQYLKWYKKYWRKLELPPIDWDLVSR